MWLLLLLLLLPPLLPLLVLLEEVWNLVGAWSWHGFWLLEGSNRTALPLLLRRRCGLIMILEPHRWCQWHWRLPLLLRCR